MSKSLESQIAELRALVEQMRFELARVNKEVRPARPAPPKHGRFLGITADELNEDGSVDVTVHILNADEWEETELVIKDARAFDDDTEIPLGAKVYVFYYENVWVLLPLEAAGLVRFELIDTLNLKGHAKAKWLNADWTDSGTEIEVYDPFQEGPGMWAGIAGYQGWAIARPGTFTDEGSSEGSEDDEERASYEVVWMEQTAQTIQFTSTEAMSGGEMDVIVNWFDHQGRQLVGTVTVHDPLDMFVGLPSGTKGTAVYDYHESFYRIVSVQQQPSLVRFELDGTLSLKGHAKAKLLDADWEELDPPVAIEVYDPYQAGPGMWAGLSGYQGWAVARTEPYLDEGEEGEEDDEERDAYDIVWMEQTAGFIQFTTSEYVGSDGEAAASISWFDHQGREIEGSVTLHDETGQFADVHNGAKGTAVYDYHNSYYRIVSAQRVALFARATLTENVCDASGSIGITNFIVDPAGDYVGDPPTPPTTALAGVLFAGKAGDGVILRRINNNMPSPGWQIIAVDTHEIGFQIDSRFTEPDESGSRTFQILKATAYVQLCGPTPTEWEDVFTTVKRVCPEDEEE